jgi:nucleoside-diphosphate-sugar epimerase
VSRIFLTGATGFVGMEVLARLVERGDEVVTMIRAADVEGAQARLDDTLSLLWRDPSSYRDLVSALPGDVTGDVPTVEADAAIHCAASISFDHPIDEARAINVEGTRKVLEAARVERLVHVSTAYVAGTYEGRFRERQHTAGQGFRNTYEQTKWEAEQLVAQSGIPSAIARPSIIMGEAATGWTPSFNVLYWPLRAFSRGLFETVPALADSKVDVVPVDYVADGIVAILDSGDQGAFNLVASDDALTATELLELACDRFDKPRPTLVPPGSPVGGSVDEHGAVYLPYFDMRLVFDATRAHRLLPAPPSLREYFDRLVDHAEAARWGKKRIGREDALVVS